MSIIKKHTQQNVSIIRGTECVISSLAEDNVLQVIDEPNLILVILKLGTVSDVVLEDAEGKYVIFDRNFASTLNNKSEPSSALMTAKEANLARRWMQTKNEDLFLVDKSNNHAICTLEKNVLMSTRSTKIS